MLFKTVFYETLNKHLLNVWFLTLKQNVYHTFYRHLEKDLAFKHSQNVVPTFCVCRNDHKEKQAINSCLIGARFTFEFDIRKRLNLSRT